MLSEPCHVKIFSAFLAYLNHFLKIISKDKNGVSKGLVTHNNILKICRIIQYSKNIFKCNMVKNIFKIYKKVTFLLKKIISV